MNKKWYVKQTMIFILALSVGLFIYSCGDDDSTGPENQAPNSISTPNPADNATDVSITPTLTWVCTDPDGDQLTYDVYFGTNNESLSITKENQTENSYTPSTILEYETTYYWQIVATDDQGDFVTGDIWMFTTATEPNEAPATPSNPNPANNAVDILLTQTLTWECSDPDNDQLTYDVYIGVTSDNLEMVSQNQDAAIYQTASLDYLTVYYWKIIARDEHSNQTTGDIWSFTTVAAPNEAPSAPSNPTPSNNADEITLTPTLTWECSDPDGDPITYDVYFGTSSESMQLISENQSAASYETDPLTYETDYYWQIIVSDDHENQINGDIWKFTTEAQSSMVIEWSVIPAGDFTFGQYGVVRNLDYDYEIMTYPVTNQQFVLFLNEELIAGNVYISSDTAFGWWDGNEIYGSGNYPFVRFLKDGKAIEWNGQIFEVEEGKENHPATDMNWIAATTFADYYSWRLPTNEEWEKAARGNTGYNYPWGESIDGSRANYRESGDPFEDESSHNTTPVGFYNGENHDGFQTTDSPSPYGVYDMDGNIWELTCTWIDDIGVSMKGNSYATRGSIMQVWQENIMFAYLTANNIGFRCVRDNQ